MSEIYFFLVISLLLFTFGLWGLFITRKNIIILLISLELLLLSVNFNFVIFSIYLDDIIGQVFALFIVTVAAAEAAIGLAILIVYYRIKGIIAINFINAIKG